MITNSDGRVYLHCVLKTFRSILSCLLAATVLVSSISSGVSFHRCGGEINAMAIFGQAEACSTHEDACDAAGNMSHSHQVLNQKGCCEDTTLSFDAYKYISKITEKKTDERFESTSLPPVVAIRTPNPFKGLAYAHFVKYKPPLINRDIAILIQTLLI